MKVLCLSDLHFTLQEVIKLLDENEYQPFVQQVRDLVVETNPDVVVVTGDSVDARQVRLLSALFTKLIGLDTPIILTLGNHEFWESSFEGTLEKLKAQTFNAPNVHFLDLIGGVEIGKINFVGGTLFFDGSMRWKESQKITPWGTWNDRQIYEIETRYLEFNNYYVELIKQSMKPNRSTLLCTHHLPHRNLNAHVPSEQNFYCGMKDLISELPFDPKFTNGIICGHTHKRAIGELIPNFTCINVGSNYGKLEHFLLEM